MKNETYFYDHTYSTRKKLENYK